MAAYIPVPRDLTRVKSKIFFNLTKRQLIIEHNNLANFETWIFFKWIFKTFVAVLLITNTFNITMAVFDVAQHVVNASAGLISGSTAVDASTLDTIWETLEAMELGPLLGLFLQSFIVQICSSILSVAIFVIVYGRMMEIYLMTSLAPIPFSTFGNREQSHIGQNYLRALFALGFQGFLIMICIGIYAVLVQTVSFTDNIIGSIYVSPLIMRKGGGKWLHISLSRVISPGSNQRFFSTLPNAS